MRTIFSVGWLAVIILASPTYGSTLIPLNPAATYLLNDGAIGAPAIDLASMSIVPGDHLLIERLGSFQFASDFYSPSDETIGVFSSSSTLLASNILHRVPGAIDIGMPWPTIPAFDSGTPTDIPEDFHITSTTVTVPAGATFLFVAAHDSRYSDNSDPDGDYMLRLTVVPEPSSAVLALLSIFGLCAFHRKLR